MWGTCLPKTENIFYIFYCEKVSTFREDLQSPSGLTVATGFISLIDIMNKGKNSSATPQDTSDSLDIKIK